jgi:AraC-like DNA-binding protein
LDGAASATRLLTGYLDVLADSLPTLGPLAIAAARNATLELFIGALRPAVLTQFGAEGLVLRTVIETWIDRNLGLLDVTPAEIAAAHGVSVRTVHRVFKASGETVCEVIRLHRLAKAHRELSVRAEPISLIARRWGFGNSRDFIAAYQAHYGMSPSDYRASQK